MLAILSQSDVALGLDDDCRFTLRDYIVIYA
jgi:hypothetical protein